MTTIAPGIPTLTGDYSLDTSHSRIGFQARHAMVTKVRGAFSEYEGRIHLDQEDPSRSFAQVTIAAASIDTGNAQRDAHLRSADFFDAERFDTITFTSTSVEAVGDDVYRLTGELTVRDVTRPVTLELEYTGAVADPFGLLRLGFEGHTTINRRDFGLEWNVALDQGGLLVSEKITIELDLAAVKPLAEA